MLTTVTCNSIILSDSNTKGIKMKEEKDFIRWTDRACFSRFLSKNNEGTLMQRR